MSVHELCFSLIIEQLLFVENQNGMQFYHTADEVIFDVWTSAEKVVVSNDVQNWKEPHTQCFTWKSGSTVKVFKTFFMLYV